MREQYQPSLEYDQDSFDQYFDSEYQMQNPRVPSAIPANNTRIKGQASPNQKYKNSNENEDCYQLTFKKQNQFKFLSGLQNKSELSQKLFGNTVQNPERGPNIYKIEKANKNNEQSNKNICEQDDKFIMLINKSKTMEQVYKIAKNESISNDRRYLKQTQLTRILNQTICNQITQIKLRTLISMIVFRSLRKKRNSVRLNIEVIKNQMQLKGTQIGEVDKRRLEILQLLNKQLGKKIFIEGLKYNKIYNFCTKILASIDFESQNQFLQQEDEQQLNDDEQFDMKRKTQHRTNDVQTNKLHYGTPNADNPYYQQSRITIFVQIINSVINKTIYPIIKKLKQTKNNENMKVDIGKKHNSPKKQEKQQVIHKQNQFLEYFPQQQEHEDPVNQLKNYIKEISNQYLYDSNGQNSLEKKYFIKWKIYFINKIIQKIQSQHGQHHQRQQEQQGNYRSQEVILSQYNSNSPEEKDLKQPKYILKQFIQVNKKRLFFKLLNQCLASKGIKQVTQNYSRKNLLKKSFYALFQNKQKSLNNKWMKQYALQIAQNQDQSQKKVSQIFYKTNCLTKIFFGWNKMVRCSKFVILIEKFVIRYSFNLLKSTVNKDHQNQVKLRKLIERKRRRTLFKAFCMIKNQTSYSEQLNSKAKDFRIRKNYQLLEICFSAISLAWKKQLAFEKNIQNIICVSSIKTFFDKFKIGLRNRCEQQDLQFQALQILNICRKRKFFTKFKQNYLEFLYKKSIRIKQAKIQISHIRNYAKQGLKRWKRLCIRNKNYQIIEKKLKRVKEGEQKEKILKIWYERLIQKYRLKKKDRITSNHKNWLNKYYQKLCAFDQEELD